MLRMFVRKGGRRESAGHGAGSVSACRPAGWTLSQVVSARIPSVLRRRLLMLVLGATTLAAALAPAVVNPTPSSAAATTVAVGNNWFGNSGSVGATFVIDINVGDTVEWVWGAGANVHNVTETDSAFTPNGGSDVGASVVAALAYGPKTFNNAGTFYYVCTLHETQMMGRINVTAIPPTAVTVAVGNNWFGNSGSVGATFVIDIRAGDTVEWVWGPGANVHNITESDATFTPNGGSDVGSSAVAALAYGPITFNNAGTFYYLCTLHETQMMGRVNVTGSSGGGGGGGGISPGPVKGPSTSLVRIGFPEGATRFSPASITVTAGDTVTWALAYGDHDVTSGYPLSPSYQSPGGKAGMPSSASSYSRVFSTPGTYTFYCDEHSGESQARLDRVDEEIANGNMVGKIVVLAADATGPTTSGVSVSPNPANGVSSVTVSATVTDSGSPSSIIINAEAFIGPVGAPGTGSFLPRTDSAWDATSETVSGSVSIAALGVGTYSVSVRGQDQRGNWGAVQSTSLTIATAGGGGGEPGPGVTANIIVLSGSLTNLANPVTFPDVSLTGLDLLVATSPPAWEAVDSRGTGAGWNVTVTSTDFTSSSGSIPVSNFKVRLPSSAITTVTGGAPPTTQAPNFVPLSTTAAQKIIAAALGAGMGTYRYLPEFQLAIGGATQTGTFTASLVVTINSAP